MHQLSLLTKSGLMLPEDKATRIKQAMKDGRLYAKSYVLKSRHDFHPYVADQQEVRDFPTPTSIRSESDALSLIGDMETVHHQPNLIRVELVTNINGGDHSAVASEPFRITRYCPDADASGLTFLGENHIHLDEDERRAVMRCIHEGLAVVSGHRMLYLPDSADEIPSILDWPYSVPISVTSGNGLMELIEKASANPIVNNLVSVMLEVRLQGEAAHRYCVGVYKPSPMEWDIEPTLWEFDWMNDECSLFHSLKFRGKSETEAEILGSLKTICPFTRHVVFNFNSLDEGEGEPFMPWVTISVGEASPDIDKIDQAIKEFSRDDFKRHQSDGRVSWGFYTGEGPFAHTTFNASSNIDAFTPKVCRLLQGINETDIAVEFHIDLCQ